MSEIVGVGCHLPLSRLERAAAVAALRWSGLGGGRVGHRAVAAFDEDALTLAVEAARGPLAAAPAPGELVFASTSAPFFDRQQATLMVEALGLAPTTRTTDVAGTRRCAVSALLSALLGGDPAGTLVAAGEKRPTRAGSAAQLAWGDGGAAVLTGPRGFARLVGHASFGHDFVDLHASRDHPTPYAAEERFVRDVVVEKILAPTIRRALAAANVGAADITHAVIPEPVAGGYAALARALGLKAPDALERLRHGAGDLGAAHPLFGLGLVLEAAAVGDRVLAVGFGSGCDALVLEVTAPPPSTGAAAALKQGLPFSDVTRFLNLVGCLDLDWGARSELEQKTAAPVLERHGRDVHGFVGGRDSGGNVQFPKTRMPVDPSADPDVPLVDVRLADAPARVVSITADRLNFTPDPPFHFGLVQFDDGARVLMEFCDVPPGTLAVGSPVRMRFRIKSVDRRRGFRTYFWKAAPASRPAMEG